MPTAVSPVFARVRLLPAISALALLTACGGGSGAAPSSTRPPTTPTPTPTPTPVPTPTPTPTPPPTNFDTREFRDSDGPGFHNAITAWQAGITGAGSIIAIVDSGIDSDSPEFAGRIHPASTDVAGNRGIDGEDDHGTNVALVAAAARDNTGILGIAFNAQVLALRADTPGSCANDTPQDPSLSCLFDDRAIARGIDVAVSSGAKVVNLSLGGGAASRSVLDAVARAARAGIVVVVSAGNGGDGSEPGIDPNQPDPFAASLLQAGGANVIIVGSVDANGQLSDFSNRAGSAAASYLTARGERICCVYDNGRLFVENINGQQFVTVFSGTSFSAPQVSGAVALLAQAFPNLTGAQIVQILLDSARDAGAAGTDALYGRGILDIARALAPAGTTAIAGQSAAFALDQRVAVGSPAMGDALGRGSLSTIVTDRYRRAYNLELGAGMAGASVVPRLHGAVAQYGRSLAAGGRDVTLAFQVNDRSGANQFLRLTPDEAEGARVLAARVAARIAPGTQIGLAIAQDADGLVAQLQGRSGAAFRIAPGVQRDTGFLQQGDTALALRQQVGPWGVTFHTVRGEVRQNFAPRLEEVLDRQRERLPVQSFGLAFDRKLGALAATLGLSWLQEDRSVLGAWFSPALGQHGADSWFVDGAAQWQIGTDWTLGGATRLGLTRARSGDVIAQGSRMFSHGWAFDLTRSNVLATGDAVGLRFSQPLRVEHGGLRVNLPTSYDYASETPGYTIQRFSLAPDGRELIGELAWQGPVKRGRGGASLFYRHQPGHYADAPADVGAMVSFSAGF